MQCQPRRDGTRVFADPALLCPRAACLSREAPSRRWPATQRKEGNLSSKSSQVRMLHSSSLHTFGLDCSPQIIWASHFASPFAPISFQGAHSAAVHMKTNVSLSIFTLGLEEGPVSVPMSHAEKPCQAATLSSFCSFLAALQQGWNVRALLHFTAKQRLTGKFGAKSI